MRAKFITVSVWALLVAPAGALEHAGVYEARAALAPYDLEGSRTTEAIARLGALIPSLDGGDAREARFLRAMAAADLVLLAHRLGDGAMRDRVGAALGVDDESIEPHLSAELAALAFGTYGQTSCETREGIEVLARLRAGEDVDFAAVTGVRRDALFLGVVRERIRAQPGARLALSEMLPTPCAASCPPPYDRLASPDRRAAGAVAEAGLALARLEQAARLGDPFALAAAEVLASDRARVEELSFHATPALPRDLAIVTLGSGGHESAEVDAVVVLGHGEVRWGWVPVVRLRDDGTLELRAPDGPVLPETERVAIPTELRAALVPIEEVAPLLRALVEQRASIAIGAAPDAPGHALARLLVTARQAGVDEQRLLVRDAGGAGRVLVAEIAGGAEGDALRREVGVFVRLGGYSFSVAGMGSTDLPRVAGPDRRWRFDVEGLGAAAGRARYRTAKVGFMSSVAAGPLLAAAFTVAPRDGSLTLVLP